MTDLLYSAATWIIPLVIAIVFHEVAHGWVARAFGDHTAARAGRLTLNPIRHVDPFGTIVLPMMLALASAPIFGWAKPVPVRFDKLRKPRFHMILVALAGPGMNILLASIAAIAIGAIVLSNDGAVPDGWGGFAVRNLVNFVLINIFLAIFNLLPIPPFDGGHVVEGLLPPPLAERYARIGRFALPVLLILLVILPMVAPEANIVARVVSPIVEVIVGTMLGLVTLWA